MYYNIQVLPHSLHSLHNIYEYEFIFTEISYVSVTFFCPKSSEKNLKRSILICYTANLSVLHTTTT